MSTKAGASVATLNALVAAFNSHDIDRVMAFFATDCLLDMPRGPHPWGWRATGWEDVRALLQTRFDGIPDVHYGSDSHAVAGDLGISRWTLRGTVAATGVRIEVNGCDFYTFRDGLVVRKDSYWKIVEP